MVQASHATLRLYDASTGALRRRWPSDGLLQDASRGLAATVADDRVRLIRLADGSERDLGHGTLARFDDLGLVVADGSRIRVFPFAQLPLGAAD